MGKKHPQRISITANLPNAPNATWLVQKDMISAMRCEFTVVYLPRHRDPHPN